MHSTMRVINRKTGKMKCATCGAEHFAQIKAGTQKYFPQNWKCPNSCEMKEASASSSFKNLEANDDSN